MLILKATIQCDSPNCDASQDVKVKVIGTTEYTNIRDPCSEFNVWVDLPVTTFEVVDDEQGWYQRSGGQYYCPNHTYRTGS